MYHFQRYQFKKHERHTPSPAPALPPPAVPAPLADEKPQARVKTENNDHINLKLVGQFKIKRHTPLSKLMKAYCERQGLSRRRIRSRFDGHTIKETDTPAQLELEDANTTDVFQQQTGGVD
ncbi:small ubiquitin-related modifier 2-like [Cervus elaphus]|uniref:small ubiquitin-related modifier 2-like n=1 Tax=Cervus elaphus TaxID=9860 RepID=UPI001CC31269|nr:small ubiquitin-related modifier 2-like [Cervus elaphus]